MEVLTDTFTRIAQRINSRADDGTRSALLAEILALARRSLVSSGVLQALSRMPAELLYLIFSCLRLPSLISASAVCTAWREVILGDPRLWTNIYTSSKQKNGALHAFLDRGQTLPISLDIALKEPQSDLCDIFSAHIWHMGKIVISSRLAEDELLKFGLLDVGLGRPAPCLKHFELRLGWDVGNDIAFDTSYFAAQAPALEELWLDIPCMPVLDAFPNLRIVVTTHSEHQAFDFVWHVLLSCPRLEQAALRAALEPSDQLWFTGVPPRLPALRSLRLAIQSEDSDPTLADAARLLGILTPDVRARIDLTLTPVVAPNDLSAGAETVLIVLTPSWGGRPRYNVYAHGTTRPMRRFRAVSLEHALAFLHKQLDVSSGTLQSLTVPASLLMFAAPPSSGVFPCLHTFTVPLSQRHVIFAEQGLRLHLERMPALHTLMLRREPGGAAALSHNVLVDSVALLSCLAVRRAGLAPIERVVLQGVETRLTSADVQPYVNELVREPWDHITEPAFDRMDWWLFQAARP